MKKWTEKQQNGFFVVCMVVVLLIGFGIGMWIGQGMEDAAPQTGATVTDISTQLPIATPTMEATGVPAQLPTGTPTTEPTGVPAQLPAVTLTTEPTATPTALPTATPILLPTVTPILLPTVTPTVRPTETPAQTPTASTANPNEDEVVSVVPVNPMSMESKEAVEEAEVITYRPLLHADRIYRVMNEEALPLAGIKIGIDPGHQRKGNSSKEPVAPGSSEMKAKVSSGTQGVSTRVAEYIVNLDVSLMLRDELEALGAEVYLTRETHDIDISNVERALMMNELGVDMVLRIHCNGSENKSTKGISLFVKSKGAGAAESYAICEALMPAMLEATGARNAGIYKRDTYSGMNWSEVPSILVEMGFMSNPEEDRLLNNPNYQARLVEGMIQGIADYMGRELNLLED